MTFAYRREILRRSWRGNPHRGRLAVIEDCMVQAKLVVVCSVRSVRSSPAAKTRMLAANSMRRIPLENLD